MVEFRTDNGKYGAKRIARTATGYKGVINAPAKDIGTPIHGVMMDVSRGVGEDGEPYIEIDIAHLDDAAKENVKTSIFRALDAKGLVGQVVTSSHASTNLAIDVLHNRLGVVFEALFAASLDDGMSLLPQVYKEFVSEQQQVRNGLEQSLMHAFGKDCFLHAQGTAAKPKNEINRIQRLAQYFRQGVPEIKEKFKGKPKSEKPA
jgi:hypothetical protein